MESFLIYIGKSAIAAGAFYIVFLLLFQNQKQFVFNRIYLPVSFALSFLIPLITFTTVKYIEPTPALDFSSFTYLADSTEFQPKTFHWEWYHYLLGIYLLGAAGFLFHLLLGHLKAISIIRKSRIQKLFENLVNITKKDVHPFSFFNKIVLSEKTLSHPNLNIIVNHESIHVKEKHTLDILFTEILFLVQWFNPFAWLLKDAVKNNLEYKTDHEIAKTNDPQTYQLAMVTLADKKGVAPFLTALNGSQLKNRIIMMKKKTKNNYALLKQLVVLPLLAILVMGLSNRDVKTKFVDSKSQIEKIKDVKEARSNKFLISIQYDQNIVTLQGLTGCSYKKLSFTIKDNDPYTIDQFGLNSSRDKNKIAANTNLSDFSFKIEKKNDLFRLIGITGTNWKELSFSPSNKEHFISGFGVHLYNPEKEKIISGKVINENGEPIPAASIVIKGKETGTISDNNGYYKLNLQNGNQTLLFTAEGYLYRAVRVSGRQKIDVLLYKNKNAQGESVEIRKSNNELNENQNKVIIESRQFNEHPLYVVDGKETKNIEAINPENISNVDVLKAETAAKVYGEKGKNGVVVITTKKTTQKEKKFEISGRVTSEKGKPIQGAAVLIKGKTIGTITNTQGYYLIGTDVKIEKLSFSMEGYKTKEVSVNGTDKINVELVADKKAKKDKIKASSYRTQFNPTAVDAHTKAANTIFLKNKTGENDPLYVVNGVEMENISYLNPENIKSVNVLKDKSATNLYGEKGKNGAILITTKKPEKFNVGDPVVIVDGQEYDSMEDAEVPPEDIASIDVLKGKSATDLYGEKGKNGVIQIITKGSKEIPKGELPIVLNGKMTELTLNEVDRDLIQNIKRIEPEEAVKKYGERGKNGVFEVTSRNVYTDKVKVNSSDKITTPLELRKFIANKIKYPVEAQKNNITGTVKLWAVVESDGKITHIYEKEPKGNIENLDEVIVVAYSTPKPIRSGIKNEAASHVQNAGNDKSTSSDLTSLLTNEVKRVLSSVPAIDIPELQGKTLEFTMKFMLQ